MPTKHEMNIMAIWLKSKRIAFEVTRFEMDKSIELRFIDYKHNCLLVSRKYSVQNVAMGYKSLELLVKKFEREEIYPILFDGVRIQLDHAVVTPNFRLIREN